MEAEIHGVLGYRVGGTGAGRKLRFVLGCDSFHARFMRGSCASCPLFVHMLVGISMTDDRESPSGRPSSNIYIYIYIYIYIHPRAPLQR